MTRLRGTLRRATEVAVFRRATAILVAQGLTSASGYFYWLIGAHLYPAHEIGRAASITSISITIALIASQAVVASVLVRMPRDDRKRAMLRSSLVLTGAVAGVLACTALLVLPALVPALRILDSPILAVSTVVICVSQTLGLVCDAAALALSRLRVLIVRNALFGIGKLVLVPVIAVVEPARGAEVLVAAWAAASLLTTALAVWQLSAVTTGGGWSFRAVYNGLGYQTITAISGTVPAQLFPTIVTAQAGATMSGYFSLTWLLGGLCFSISPAVSQAMLPSDSHRLGKTTRQACLLIAMALAVPVSLFLLVPGPILRLFGTEYGVYGAPMLMLLALSAVPDAITNVAVARWRVQERLRPAAWCSAMIAVVALSLVLGPLRATHTGIASIGLAWIAAQLAGCSFMVGHFLFRRALPMASYLEESPT